MVGSPTAEKDLREMRQIILAAVLLGLAANANAISLEECFAQADAWIQPRLGTIRARVVACVQEGNPRVCHTAWAASVTPNTVAADPALATVTLDDPGTYASTVCGDCFTGEQTFAAAGIAIPATAPVNAKVNIFFPPDRVWNGQLVAEFQYEGVKYQRGYGGGGAPSFAWREVTEGP